MVEMLFSLRFQSQLRRTRPQLFSSIERTVVEAVTRSGGKIGFERRCVTASFEALSIGFWLDMLLILESLLKSLEEAAPELYGYRCILGRNLGDDRLSMLRALPIGAPGFWCAPSVQDELSPYAVFEERLAGGTVKSIVQGFARIRSIRSGTGAARVSPCVEQVQRILQSGGYRNAVLLGPRFIGKREGLYRHCAALLMDAPPLAVRFGSGGAGLCCYADAYSAPVRSLIKHLNAEESVQELDLLAAIILRERLRDQYSPYLFQKTQRFLALLLECYCKTVSAMKIKPVIILENIHEADAKTVQLFTALWQRAPAKNICRIFATCAPSAGSGKGNSRRFDVTGNPAWAKVFSKIIRFSTDESVTENPPGLPRDLWEIAYALCLLRRCFPAASFPGLFEQAGKNPLTLKRALEFFSLLGLIDSIEDPILRIHGCALQAEQTLGEHTEPIRAMVRNCLLTWVEEGKLQPCFNLLKALRELGGEASLFTIRDALTGDILNGTYKGIEEALREGYFKTVVDESRFPSLRYIFKTLKALSHGDEAEIRGAFAEPIPEQDIFPGYKAQILANLTGYYYGIQNVTSAAKTVKEAMILSQGLQDGKSLAQVYRLLSLVNLSRQRIGDALEYFSFALERAAASENYDELAVTAYYAAGVQFLYGNISQAERLARQAEETALDCGRTGWADRARFFLGRLQFETGRYEEALAIFEGLLKEEGVASPAAASAGRDLTLAAWIYRCNIFLQKNPARKPAEMNSDAFLFEVEGAYLSGKYELTVTLADRLQASLVNGSFIFVEQPDWRSGFSQCELLLCAHRDFFLRLLSTYRAMARCRISGGPGTNRAQAIESMRRITKEEGLPETEPREAFYFYAYYQVLQEAGAPEVDMNTAISMAFKRLQRRASRIDDMETKRAFLSGDYWNQALGRAAKLHKLI